MVNLKIVFRLNAISCLLFGSLFVLAPEMVSVFLAYEAPAPVLLMSVIGAVLILNGIHLIAASLQISPSRELIIYFALGDGMWVCAVTALIVSGLWITTSHGIMAAVLVNIVVGVFAVMQIMEIKKTNAGSPEHT